MFTKKTITLLAVGLAVLAVGCAPKKNSKTTTRGRLARGIPSVNPQTGLPSTQSPSASTQYGHVSAMDQNFYYAVQALAMPSLEGSGDQLGNVSPQPSQSRGIYFWGDGLPHYNAPAFNTGRLHIEIWDDLAGQVGADGQVLPPVVIHIGADQEGFQGVSGQGFGGQVNLTFSSLYNVVTLQGYVQGNQYVGTFVFTNTYAQNMTLGQFTVPACGFFRCQ